MPLAANLREKSHADSLEWALEREAVIRLLADQLRLTEATVQGAANRLGLNRVAIDRLVRLDRLVFIL